MIGKRGWQGIKSLQYINLAGLSLTFSLIQSNWHYALYTIIWGVKWVLQSASNLIYTSICCYSYTWLHYNMLLLYHTVMLLTILYTFTINVSYKHAIVQGHGIYSINQRTVWWIASVVANVMPAGTLMCTGLGDCPSLYLLCTLEDSRKLLLLSLFWRESQCYKRIASSPCVFSYTS